MHRLFGEGTQHRKMGECGFCWSHHHCFGVEDLQWSQAALSLRSMSLESESNRAVGEINGRRGGEHLKLKVGPLRTEPFTLPG